MDDKSLETHLGFIQNVITRMGQNSFQAKAWCIAMLTALYAFVIDKEGNNSTLCLMISMIVTVLFCLLDTYYLYLERGYRNLYNVCAGLVEGKTVKKYDMKIPQECKGGSKYFKALISFSTGAFYLAILCGLILLLIVC